MTQVITGDSAHYAPSLTCICECFSVPAEVESLLFHTWVRWPVCYSCGWLLGAWRPLPRRPTAKTKGENEGSPKRRPKAKKKGAQKTRERIMKRTPPKMAPPWPDHPTPARKRRARVHPLSFWPCWHWASRTPQDKKPKQRTTSYVG